MNYSIWRISFILFTCLYLAHAPSAAQSQSIRIRLAWDPNPEVRVTGYNVYRSLSSRTGYTRINKGLVAQNEFVDTAGQRGVRYYYVVTAVDAQGKESAHSNEVTALAPQQSVRTSPGSSFLPVSVDKGHPLLGFTFIGTALSNPKGVPNSANIQGLNEAGSQQEVNFNANIPPNGQHAYMMSDIVRFPRQVSMLRAKGQPDSLSTSFMIGDNDVLRFEGLSGDFKESRTLYFPLARQSLDPHHETTLLFLFNPGNIPAGVGIRLFRTDGSLITDRTVSLAGNGSMAATLSQIFGGGTVVTEGFIRVDATAPVSGFQLHADRLTFAGIHGQIPVAGKRLLVPHFFTDLQAADTEVRLMNLEDFQVTAQMKAFIENTGRTVTKQFQIEPRSLFVGSVRQMLELQGRPEHITGHIEFSVTGRSGAEQVYARVVGAVVYAGNGGRSRAMFAMADRGQTAYVFPNIAQCAATKFFTGLAIWNPNNQAARITVRAFDRAGVKTSERTLDLAPGKKVVDLLNSNNLFRESFQQVGGHLQLTSTLPVSSFALLGDHSMEILVAIEGQAID
jgi:hypothetical protein